MNGLDRIGGGRLADVAATQELLNLRAGALGIAPLRTDGVLDAATRRALTNYAIRLTAAGGKARGADAVAAGLADTSASNLMREGARGRHARDRMSGVDWEERAAAFADSRKLADLAPLFAVRATRFIDALTRAGARVHVEATRRSSVRAWLVRNAHAVAVGAIAPADVPPEPQAPVIWDHGDLNRSRAAAGEMAKRLGPEQPYPEGSPHFDGHVISMAVRWSGPIELIDGYGAAHRMYYSSDGSLHPVLQQIGESYGLSKSSVPPDWASWDTGQHQTRR